MLTPYKKQIDAIEHLTAILRTKPTAAALNGSDTGTGKTLCSVEVARRLGVPVVVVCPKIVIPSWEATFVQQGVPCLKVTNYEKLRTGNTEFGSWVRGAFVWKLPPGALVIWDEVHRAQGAYTKNSKMLIGAKLCGLRSLALSATAAEDPTELRALGYLLGLHSLTNFVSWAKERGCTFDNWGKLVFTKSRSMSKTFLSELHGEIYPSKGAKLTRDDLAEHFKDSQIITDPLDFGDAGKISKIYADMEKEIAALKENCAGDSAEVADNALTQQLRARQMVELLKIPALLELMDDALSEGRSVAVFVNFRDTLDAIAERMKLPFGVVVGGQGAAEREEAVKNFQTNVHRVILCNISAGGVGVNLHDETGAAPRTALISPSFNAKEILQVRGRVDRAGGGSESIQRILVAAGTIEEDILRSIQNKIQNMSTLHQAVKLPDAPEPEDFPAHAVYSPSSLKYREISPRFKSRDHSSEASEKGTRIHYACETGDFSKLKDDEERYIAEMLLGGVRNIIEKHHEWKEGSYERLNEIRLTIQATDIDTFGTCDLLATRGDEAIMIDYKTGVSVIDSADENLQAQCYVAGGFQKFPELQTIHFYFLVPVRDEILSHTFTRADLPNILLRINTVIRRAQQAKKCNPQFGICEYCHFQGSCKDLAEKMLPLAKKYGDGYVTPLNIRGEDASSPEELSQLMVLAKQVKKWAESVEVRGRKAVAEDGWDLPDFKSITVRGSPEVLSTVGAFRSLDGKIDLENFLACTDLNLGKLGDFFSDRAPKGQKGKEKEKMVDTLRDAGVLDEGRVSYQLRQKRK
jgi:superfamily II DNA or RNA helicase